MKKAQAVNIIGGADGPTSIFLVTNEKKQTIKQRLREIKYQFKKAWVEKHISQGSHTLEEVCKYIKDKYGFCEIDKNTKEYQEEYVYLRSSFLMQHAPWLLGEYEKSPELLSYEKEVVGNYMEAVKKREQAALEVPKADFDIEFHKYKGIMSSASIDIIIEKRFGYIGGGATGNKKAIKTFEKIYKDIYRYYGVTQEDIVHKTQRYNELVKTLAR